MRYDTEGRNPLAPHQYQHDLVLPASYIVVAPRKGHSTTFRVHVWADIAQALQECRKRGFRPLYVVRAKRSRKRETERQQSLAHQDQFIGAVA